jgi:hypothetical protein
MTTEGIYHYIATVTDAEGTVYEDTIAVIVMPKTDLEALLQNKWNEMKAALLAGNLDLALSYFVPSTQDRYRRLLGGFTPNKINSIFSNIIGLELNVLLGNVAECAALRQESDGIYAYTVTFVLDQNGVWRIIGF